MRNKFLREAEQVGNVGKFEVSKSCICYKMAAVIVTVKHAGNSMYGMILIYHATAVLSAMELVCVGC
jgi:hypothetical protein